MSANSALKEALESAEVPGIAQPLGRLGRVRRADVAGARAEVEIELGFPFESIRADLETRFREEIRIAAAVDHIELALSSRIVAHGVQPNLKPLPNVANVIAIASGKGGVGKSTAAANLDRKSVV